MYMGNQDIPASAPEVPRGKKNTGMLVEFGLSDSEGALFAQTCAHLLPNGPDICHSCLRNPAHSIMQHNTETRACCRRAAPSPWATINFAPWRAQLGGNPLFQPADPNPCTARPLSAEQRTSPGLQTLCTYKPGCSLRSAQSPSQQASTAPGSLAPAKPAETPHDTLCAGAAECPLPPPQDGRVVQCAGPATLQSLYYAL